MPTRFSLLASALLGLSLPFAFAPFGWFWLAWFTPALLLWQLDGLSAKGAWQQGFSLGLGLFGFGIYWIFISISQHSATPWLIALLLTGLLVAYMALFPALACYLLQRGFAHRSALTRVFAFSALWVGSEWLRGWLFTGFPWMNLGYSQTSGPLAGYFAIGGIHLVGLLVLVLSCSLVHARKHPTWLALPLTILALGWGLLRLDWTHDAGPALSLAAIQGNIPQDDKWLVTERGKTIRHYQQLTEPYWGKTDLIIWPEAAIPAFPQEIDWLLSDLDAQAREHQQAFITGIPTFKPPESYYNSIMVLGQGDGLYHKHHLVPFGEYVPFEASLRRLGGIFDLAMSSFSAGNAQQDPFRLKGVKVAAATCYEVAYSNQVRENLQHSHWLLTLSNDTWFGDSIGPHQHLQLVSARALENGRPVVRVTNNGITAIINSRGQIQQQIPQFMATSLQAEIQGRQGSTPFSLFGPIPILVLLGLILLSCLAGTDTRRQANGVSD